MPLGERVTRAPVHVVGGSSVFRKGLADSLMGTAFQVCAEFGASEKLSRPSDCANDPEIVIYVSSGDVGISARDVRSLFSLYEDARLLVLAPSLSVEELGVCLRAGVAGYLLSSISRDVLLHSVTLIGLGEIVFPSGLAAAWLDAGPGLAAAEDSRRMKRLTVRERDILDCLVQGKSNKQIARSLGISEATVKIHVKSLIRKLNVSNRTQVALWGLRVAGRGNGSDAAA